MGRPKQTTVAAFSGRGPNPSAPAILKVFLLFSFLVFDCGFSKDFCVN